MSLSPIRKPEWIRVKLPTGKGYSRLKSITKELSLNTVCEESLCPNIEECWNGGTATFMVMGDTCTRGCRFCKVKTGKRGMPLDPDEPQHVADAVNRLNLNYVVLTSVDRDDLADGGAEHFARVVRAIKEKRPGILVETLIPDFNEDPKSLDIILQSGADVIAQNIETVKRLTRKVRDRKSGYRKTLNVLSYLKKADSKRYTKSSIMLGLGETEAEVLETCDDLRSVGVDILTMGQYLQPSQKHLVVQEFVHPDIFSALKIKAEAKGFAFVASGPLVRSSYRAGELFIENLLKKRKVS